MTSPRSGRIKIRRQTSPDLALVEVDTDATEVRLRAMRIRPDVACINRATEERDKKSGEMVSIHQCINLSIFCISHLPIHPFIYESIVY